MIDAETTYYANKKHPVRLPDLILATEKDDGFVHYHRAGGGFMYKRTPESFLEEFAVVPRDEVEAMLARFKPAQFSLGDDDATIDGFTNGDVWNGWEMPYLTKAAIEEATAVGGFLADKGMDRVSKFLYIPETNDILEVSLYDGGEFSGPCDLSKVRDIVLHNPEPSVALRGMGLSAYTTPKVEIVMDGDTTPTTVYCVGNGWTWERAITPEQRLAASAPGM